MNDKNSRQVPKLFLEKYSIGEANDEEKRLIEGAMTAETLKKEIAAIRTDNSEILSHYSPQMMSTRIKSKLEEKESVFAFRDLFKPSFAVPVMVAAALALALFTFVPKQTVNVIQGVDILTKGHHSYLNIYRQINGEYEKLASGDSASRGDRLQVRYIAAEATHGVVFSVDGSGTYTLHFPETKKASTLLSKDGETSLTHSYELDAAPRFENFYFVTSTSSIDVTVVLKAAKASKNGLFELPKGMEQSQFEVKKVK